MTSSEPPDALGGDGHTLFDIVLNGQAFDSQSTGVQPIPHTGGVAEISLQLRAERDARRGGRTYTVSCHAVNAVGNVGASRAATVTVPR